MINNVEIIGIIAGCCTTFSTIPQIKKIIQNRSAKDISFLMYLLNCIGFILWITYAVLIGSLALILANIVTLILQATVLVLKIRWE